MSAEQLTMKLPRTRQNEQVIVPGEAHDAALLQRIAAGNEAALQELYAMHGRRLYAYALRLTADEAQAEDVLQDTLVAVWHSAASFRGEGRPLAWLLGIVHHTAVKSLRRKVEPITERMEESLPASEAQPEEQVQAGDRSACIRQGLASLSPEHRAVIDLVFYQGLSLQEVASVMECPLGTVKSRLSYARRYLRGVLERMED